ncbi:MAG: hypothetical protein IKC22_06960 [Bacilli bacterium]|nr:hypothetical protein [Bacilli bacterium]
MKKRENFTEILFKRAFVIIPLIFLLIIAIVLFKPFDTVNLEKVRHTQVQDCLKENFNAAGKQGKYYVLFYTESDRDNEIIKEAVLAYYNAEKKLNSELNNIYLVKANESNITQIRTIDSKIDSLSKLPYMILVSDGSVSTKYDTNSEIANALYSALLK